MSVLKALARRRFASGGVGMSDPRVKIPEANPPTASLAAPDTGGRQYHPLDQADYYTYGQAGPEHQFFTGRTPAAPLQPNNLPTAPTAGSSGSGGGAGVLNDIVSLAGTAKTAGQLANMAGIDNSYTQAMQNPIGAIKDAYGNYSLNNNVGSGKYANSAVNDANLAPEAISGLGAAGVASALGSGTGAGVTASITPELIGAGEGAIGATTGGAGAAAAGAGAEGAGAAGGAGAGSAAGAAAPLGATAAGAAILAAAAMGIYGGDQRGNSLNKAAKNQQARDSLLAYLSQRDSLGRNPTDPNSTNLPEWLRPETASGYGDYFHLPDNLTADQYRALSPEDQQKDAADWVDAGGGNYLTGKVEGTSYDQSGGTQLSQRQKDISKYGVLEQGNTTGVPEGYDQSAIYGTVGDPSMYGWARGGQSFVTGKPGVLAYTQDPKFNGPVRGKGTGRSDEIPARLSDGEYVMDAETVSMLGDGSTDAGAKKLDAMRAKLRAHKGKTLARGKFSPNAKDPMEYL